MFRALCRLCPAVAVVVALVACGGGGDGTTPPTTPPPGPVAPTVALSTTAATLTGIGATSTLTATATPASSVITWTSSNPALVSVVGQGTTATLTAVASGSAQITATATNGSLSATAIAAVQVIPVVRQISVVTTLSSLTVGQQVRATPTITGDSAASRALTWTSSDATLASVDSSGLIVAIAPGTVTIRATSVATPTVSGSVALTITAAPRVRTITVSPAADSALIGQSRAFVATVSADSGVVRTVVWRSSTPSVATIDNTGRVTAVGAGSTTITALAVADSTVRATAILSVRAPVVRSVSFTLASSVAVGRTVDAVPTVVADSGADVRMTWSSSTPAIAQIDASGRVTAISAGTTTITLRSVAVPAVSRSATLSVVAPPFTSVWNSYPVGAGGAVTSTNINGLVATNSDVVTLHDGSAPNIPGGQTLLTSASPSWLSRGPLGTQYAGRYGGRAAGSSTSDVFFGLRANGQPFSGYPLTTALVLRWNGTSIEDTQWPAPTPSAPSMSAITSLGFGQVLAVAADGSVRRYASGTGWTTVSLAHALGTVTALAAWTPDSAAVGRCRENSASESTVSIWRAGTFTALPATALGDSPSSFAQCAYDVLALPGGEVLATLGRTIGRFANGAWSGTSPTLGADDFFTALVRCGSTSYAGTFNGYVYQVSGTTLTQIAEPGDAAYGQVREMACSADGTVRVGSGRGLVTRRAGNGWIDEHFAPSLGNVQLTSPTHGILVGGGGTVFAWNGTAWTKRRRGALSDSYADGWVSPDGQLFVVGRNADPGGRGIAAHFNGSAWTTETLADDEGTSVWGTSANNVYRLTTDNTTGRIQRYNGSAWTTVATAPRPLGVIRGASASSIFAVGRQGEAWRFDGTAWSVMPSVPNVPASVSVRSLLVASNTVVYAGVRDCFSATGGLWRWNGTSWSDAGLQAAGFPQCVQALFGTGPDDVYAVVEAATVSSVPTQRLVRWNGSTWTELSPGTLGNVNGGSAVPGFSVIARSNSIVVHGTSPASVQRRR